MYEWGDRCNEQAMGVYEWGDRCYEQAMGVYQWGDGCNEPAVRGYNYGARWEPHQLVSADRFFKLPIVCPPDLDQLVCRCKDKPHTTTVEGIIM